MKCQGKMPEAFRVSFVNSPQSETWSLHFVGDNSIFFYFPTPYWHHVISICLPSIDATSFHRESSFASVNNHIKAEFCIAKKVKWKQTRQLWILPAQTHRSFLISQTNFGNLVTQRKRLSEFQAFWCEKRLRSTAYLLLIKVIAQSTSKGFIEMEILTTLWSFKVFEKAGLSSLRLSHFHPLPSVCRCVERQRCNKYSSRRTSPTDASVCEKNCLE